MKVENGQGSVNNRFFTVNSGRSFIRWIIYLSMITLRWTAMENSKMEFNQLLAFVKNSTTSRIFSWRHCLSVFLLFSDILVVSYQWILSRNRNLGICRTSTSSPTFGSVFIPIFCPVVLTQAPNNWASGIRIRTGTKTVMDHDRLS